MNKLIIMDRYRYPHGNKDLLRYLKYFRKTQSTKNPILKKLYRRINKKFCLIHGLEIPDKCVIGGGLYIGHPYNITINPNAVIGSNVNIHKGVTIGQENRGKRKGAPVIGDYVWIGVNATVVGNVKIGNDVLIAANTFVNCDVPDHSVVYGNPCIIKAKDNATEGYIENKA